MHAFGRPSDPADWNTLQSMSDGRAIHAHAKRQISVALGNRSWSWLADQIGVPQSTLAGQVGKPKFSLEVIWRIAQVLELDLHELLGLAKRKSDSR